jgi:Tfp pilus assembly protein PilO
VKAQVAGRFQSRDVKIVAIAAGAVLLALVLSYLVLIGPKRARVSDLDAQIASTEQQVAAARAASQVVPPEPARVDQLFRLTKAMPDQTDMPGMLLELSRIAAETGIRFESITPSVPAAGVGAFQTVPVQLAFEGNYYELSDFLFRLRSLVAKQGDRLDVSGRLYSVDSVDFAQGSGPSQLTAQVAAKAFVYSNAAQTGAEATTAPPPAEGTAG